MSRPGYLTVQVMLIGGLIAVTQVNAQSGLCPSKDGDTCDLWYLAQRDKLLAAVLAEAASKIDSFSHPDTRTEAKDELQNAQRIWVQFREAECKAASAFMWLRSARTREGFTAACMDGLTRQRIAELKKRYHLAN